MKRLVVILALFCAAPSFGNTLVDRFDRGVRAYEEGRFQESLGIFEELHGAYQVQSPDVLVNLGAASWQAGMPGKALVYLLRAISVDPSSEYASLANVNADRIRAHLNQERQNAGFLYDAYHDGWTAWFRDVPLTYALFSFVGLWALLFILLGIWRLRPTGRLYQLVIALAVLTASAGLTAYGVNRVQEYRIAVVTATQAGLYDTPASLEPAMILPEAVEMRLLGTQGNFVHVRLSSGQTGYVQDKVVGIVR